MDSHIPVMPRGAAIKKMPFSDISDPDVAHVLKQEPVQRTMEEKTTEKSSNMNKWVILGLIVVVIVLIVCVIWFLSKNLHQFMPAQPAQVQKFTPAPECSVKRVYGAPSAGAIDGAAAAAPIGAQPTQDELQSMLSKLEAPAAAAPVAATTAAATTAAATAATEATPAVECDVQLLDEETPQLSALNADEIDAFRQQAISDDETSSEDEAS